KNPQSYWEAVVQLHRRQFLHLTAATAALPAFGCSAWAQAYPAKPVYLIVTFQPAARPTFREACGAMAVGEPRPAIRDRDQPGFGGNVATEYVVNSPADGYTILMPVSTNAVNATLYPNLSFNFMRDIAPIAGIAKTPFVVVVPASFPAKTLLEFIAYAKANP